MAQNFVGSNNINLLEPHGQFGCLSPNTPILLWNGNIKNAKDILVGDILVGDDGNKRIVEDVCQGQDKLYEIQQSNGITYIVNSKHTLVLREKQKYIDLYNNIKNELFQMDFETKIIQVEIMDKKKSKVTKLLHDWLNTDSGDNIHNMMGGQEEDPGFDLYRFIVQDCHKAVPVQQLQKNVKLE
jgi:hypothetical protein